MGVAQRGTIAAELLAGGLDPATPVAAVQSATTTRGLARCRLDELAGRPVDPAVIVIGAVATLEVRAAPSATAANLPA